MQHICCWKSLILNVIKIDYVVVLRNINNSNEIMFVLSTFVSIVVSEIEKLGEKESHAQFI